MSSLNIPTSQAFAEGAQGKIVIITGAASGIGFATARLFATSGAQVVIADLNEDSGNRAAKDIGYGCIFIKCNVTSWQDQLQLFTTTFSRFGKIDLVVCNAGIDPEIIFAGSHEREDVQKAKYDVRYNFLADELEAGSVETLKSPPNNIMDVNVTGVIYGVKLSVHFMRKTGGGRIVVIGSAASYIAVPEQAIYCASKHAVLGLVRATSGRSELKKNNISISMVAPWLTTTPLTSDVDNNLTAGVSASSATDVTWAVAYLAAEPLKRVNGKSISVQGQTYTEVEESVSNCHYQMMKR